MNYSRRRGRMHRDSFGRSDGRYLGASAIVDNPEFALASYGLGNPMVGEAIRLGGLTDLCVLCGGSGSYTRKGGCRCMYEQTPEGYRQRPRQADCRECHIRCYECRGKGRRPQFDVTADDALDDESRAVAQRMGIL